MMLWLPATFAWAAKEFWTPCFKMTVAGAIGSSDVTIADFLVALLHDRSLEECPRLAVAVGACNVEGCRRIERDPHLGCNAARLAAGWERQPLDLDCQDWNFDEGSKLWRGPVCAIRKEKGISLMIG